MEFPITRLRRLRRNEPLRSLVRETRLEPSALILPLFLCPGEGVRREIGSMPGVFNLSVDEAVKQAEAAAALGIGGLLLFGLPETKDEQATGAWDDNGIVQRGLRALKQSAAVKKLEMCIRDSLWTAPSVGNWMRAIDGIDDAFLESVIDRVPPEWALEADRQFARTQLRARRRRLVSLIDLSLIHIYQYRPQRHFEKSQPFVPFRT